MSMLYRYCTLVNMLLEVRLMMFDGEGGSETGDDDNNHGWMAPATMAYP